MPQSFVEHVRTLPRTLMSATISTQTNLLRAGIWELAARISRALAGWRASAPGLARLRIVEDGCAYAELATWRLALFLLSGRCAEIGITFAVDVRVRDMDRVLALAL